MSLEEKTGLKGGRLNDFSLGPIVKAHPVFNSDLERSTKHWVIDLLDTN